MSLWFVPFARVAGPKGTRALAAHALGQSDMLLAQLFADNALVTLRLSRQMPALGETRATCEQAGQVYEVTLAVAPTPNPNFHRVDASASRGASMRVRVLTVPGPCLIYT